MKKFNILLILSFLNSGCLVYREKFTTKVPILEKGIPVKITIDGQTNFLYKEHTVNIKYGTMFMWGKAAQLASETQTDEFIRTVNAEDINVGVDTNSIKSISEGMVIGAGKVINPF